MATFYLDFENGNDANTGIDWANAWKTLNNGATAARIAPNDVIRIAKTADPVSIGNATWTNKSATVTLAAAKTTNIYLDGAWTAANGGSATTTTTAKQGSNASSITTAATTATTTKYAYYATGTIDLSSYDAITFWIQNASVSINENNYQIKLCSDTTGDIAVDTFNIPAISSTARWVPLTLTRNGSGTLGSAIKSIAFYTGSSSPGNSRNIFIDNIMGCTANGLNLTSLISKSSLGFSTSETWHGLQSINGTTIILGQLNGDSAGSANLRGYYTTGTSPETVTTYVRPTYKFSIQSGFTDTAQPIMDSGTAGNLITFSGGWNTSTNTQDGCTWIDGQNGLGLGINGNSRNYLSFNRINTCRFNVGYSTNSSTQTGWVIANTISCNHTTTGYDLILTNSDISIITNNTSQTGLGSGSKSNNISMKLYNNIGTVNMNRFPNLYYELLIYNQAGNLRLFNVTDTFGIVDYIDSSGSLEINSNFNGSVEYLTLKNLTTAISGGSGNGKLIINKLTASGNTNMGTHTGELIVKQTDATSNQLIGTTNATTQPFSYPALQFNSVNNSITDNRSYWQYGNALSQTTTRHTASGIAWQINITNADQTIVAPIYYPIAKVACNANALVTVKAWVKLSHATDIGAKLMIQAYEIAGVTADVTATKSADTNWEELTITFTPTVAGVAQIYVQGYWLANTADESIFVDDVTISQA